MSSQRRRIPTRRTRRIDGSSPLGSQGHRSCRVRCGGGAADALRPRYKVVLMDIARQAKLKAVAKEFEVVDAPRWVMVLDEDTSSIVNRPTSLDDDSEWVLYRAVLIPCIVFYIASRPAPHYSAFLSHLTLIAPYPLLFRTVRWASCSFRILLLPLPGVSHSLLLLSLQVYPFSNPSLSDAPLTGHSITKS
ncbi:hypothetical protein MVEN_00361400 [Mycena venus]|uniref:Uncharacterized protein n=1 Tax=Mycena venus TaxID=2733690 RepID=A0A8H6YUJ6_9AGAR|nr:hypothetical protein MVEN_00361400 [Mycena venus]